MCGSVLLCCVLSGQMPPPGGRRPKPGLNEPCKRPFRPQVKWRRVMLDEAHCIKDKRCNTAKAVHALDARYRWALSGTPLQARGAGPGRGARGCPPLSVRDAGGPRAVQGTRHSTAFPVSQRPPPPAGSVPEPCTSPPVQPIDRV